MKGAKGEANDEIVDAHRSTDENEPPHAQVGGLVAFRTAGQPGHEAVHTNQPEQRTRHWFGCSAQVMRHGVPEQETNDRHETLEHPEDQRDAEAEFPIDAGNTKSGRSGEVVQANRHRDEEERDHLAKVIGGPKPLAAYGEPPPPVARGLLRPATAGGRALFAGRDRGHGVPELFEQLGELPDVLRLPFLHEQFEAFEAELFQAPQLFGA